MEKRIVYNRQDRDFSAFLNGELVGIYATRDEAQNELDRLAFELLSRGL